MTDKKFITKHLKGVIMIKYYYGLILSFLLIFQSFSYDMSMYATIGGGFPIGIIQTNNSIVDAYNGISSNNSDKLNTSESFGGTFSMNIGGYDESKFEKFGIGWIFGYAFHCTGLTTLSATVNVNGQSLLYYISSKYKIHEFKLLPTIHWEGEVYGFNIGCGIAYSNVKWNSKVKGFTVEWMNDYLGEEFNSGIDFCA